MLDSVQTVALLKKIILLSGAPIDLESKLDQMLKSLSETFEADRCLLLKPAHLLPNGFFSRIAAEGKPLWIEDRTSISRQGWLPEEEALLSPSTVCVPLGDEPSSQGILCLGFLKPRPFSPDAVDLLVLIGKEMEGAIKKDYFRLQMERFSSELAVLHELGNVVTSTIKLEDLLMTILVHGSRILKTKGGALRLEDRRTGELRVRSSLGKFHESPYDERLAKRVLFTQKPLYSHHENNETPSFSILCAPLISNGKSFGTLAFYDPETNPSKLDEGLSQILFATANQISCCVQNALTHYELSEMVLDQESRVGQLSMLWELNKVLLTTIDFDHIVHMVLTAITLGEGLGFNRAMLFLINERNPLLEGIMAVGPDSAEEAGKIWSTIPPGKGNLSDLVTQLSHHPSSHSVLHTTVKQIRIPLQEGPCILTRTILEQKPFNMAGPRIHEEPMEFRCERDCSLRGDAGCGMDKSLGADSETYAFATVPLWGKGRVIGLILVDNLFNRRPIREKDVEFLSMFSNQAGLAIENTRLHRHLEEVHQELKEAEALLVHREKMAALGEMADTVAHEIRNPLVVIGGFARRLDRAVSEDTPEQRYSRTIVAEVTRLEKILNDILHYTSNGSAVYEECHLSNILEDSLSMVPGGFNSGGIELHQEVAKELPVIHGDYRQLKQVFFNLITNARQSMGQRGRLSIRAFPVTRHGATSVRVEVEDIGNGIDPQELHHIFNPFFTTKLSNLGLGLSTVYKIITSHRGDIEVDNHPGKGTNFIITLPVRSEEEEKPDGPP